MTWNWMRGWLGTFARLVLGVVWIWTGWSKLHAPRTFAQTVRAYHATPEWLSVAIAFGAPVLGLAVGILLIIGIMTRVAAVVSGLLLLAFLIGLIQAAARGIKLNWGAFNDGGPTIGATHYPLEILFVVVLLAGSVLLVLWPLTRLSLEEYLARHDYVEPPSAKRMRSDQGQRKYLAQVAAKQEQARIRTRYITAGLGIVIVLTAIIGIGVQSGRAKIGVDPSTDNASSKYGVVYGKVSAARVDIYLDYQCVKCREFNQAVHTTLESDVKANLAQVHYYTLSLLDTSSSGNRYSSRAASAALCAADASVDDFVKYNDVLFGNGTNGAQVQPSIGGKGRTDSDLLAYAKQAGITGTKLTTFTTCVQVEGYGGLVQALTDTASKRGVSTVPTVKVNGKTITPTLAALTAAITAADKKGPAPKPSPTPSPSSSGSAVASKSVSPSPSG